VRVRLVKRDRPPIEYDADLVSDDGTHLVARISRGDVWVEATVVAAMSEPNETATSQRRTNDIAPTLRQRELDCAPFGSAPLRRSDGRREDLLPGD